MVCDIAWDSLNNQKKFWPVRNNERECEHTPVPHKMDSTCITHGLCIQTLRKYQIDALEKIANAKRGYLRIPCGGGKTLVAAACACHPDEGHVLILAGNKKAAKQLYSELNNNTTLGDRLRMTVDQQTAFAMKRPLPERMVHVTSYDWFVSKTGDKNMLSWASFYLNTQWSLLVLDEVHMAMATTTWKRIKMILPDDEGLPPRAIGLTGTPFRKRDDEGSRSKTEDRHNFLDPLGPLIYEVPMRDDETGEPVGLENLGMIAKMFWIRVTVPPDPDIVGHTTLEKRDVAALSANKTDTLRAIVATHLSRGEKGMVYLDKIAVAEALALTFEHVPEFRSAAIITGRRSCMDTKGYYTDVADKLKRLECGDLDVLLVSRCCDESLNLPIVSFVIMLDCKGDSIRQKVQRAGRASRTIDEAPSNVHETDEDALARRLKNQKSASIYTLVTENSNEEEENAAFEKVLTEQNYTLANGRIIHKTDREVIQEAKRVASFEELSPELRTVISSTMAKRQENNAGHREGNAAANARRDRNKMEAAKDTARLQSSHPLFKNRVASSCANRRKAREELVLTDRAEAIEIGRIKYIEKREGKKQKNYR